MNYSLKHYAYLGDCVWELFIRNLVIEKVQTQEKMHKLTTKYVQAQAQADLITEILPELSQEELDIQHRGRNLKITINKRNNPKIHSLATSFECVIGYLYLTDKKRLSELLDKIKPLLEDFQ